MLGAVHAEAVQAREVRVAPVVADAEHDDAEVDVEAAEETVCYANSLPVKIIGWVLWVIVVAANVYAIVSLGLGTAST